MLQDTFRLNFHDGIVGGIGLHEDVASLDTFRRLEIIATRGVFGLQLGVSWHIEGSELLGINHDDGVALLLGDAEFSLVGFVVGGQFRLGGFRLGLVLGGGEKSVLNSDLVVLALVFRLDILRGYQDTLSDDLFQLGDENLTRRLALEIGKGHALLLEKGGESCAVHFAVFYDLGWQAVDDGGVGFVSGNLQAEAVCLIGHGAFVDHLLNNLGHIDGEQFGGELPIPGHVLDGAVHVLGGNGLRANCCDDGRISGSTRVRTGGDEVGDHREGDEAQQDTQKDANRLVAAAEKVKH